MSSEATTDFDKELAAVYSQPRWNQGVVDTQRAMQSSYMDEMQKVINRHKAWESPYYVCVQRKRCSFDERRIRQIFYARQTRPAPQHDMDLWVYTPKDEALKFEWSLPDRARCQIILNTASSLPDDHKQLIQMVKAFSEGKLS